MPATQTGLLHNLKYQDSKVVKNTWVTMVAAVAIRNKAAMAVDLR